MVGIEPDTRVNLRIWVAMPTVRTRRQTYRSAFLSCSLTLCHLPSLE